MNCIPIAGKPTEFSGKRPASSQQNIFHCSTHQRPKCCLTQQ